MQPGPVYLSNRYAVLEEDLLGLSGEKERNSSAEISTQQQCCQQLSSMIMELFSKEAILISQSLALLLDKINAIDVKEGAIYETELDLRSHQVISMPSGAPIKVKSLALELREAEAEQARTQQCQLIPMDGMSKEAEGKLILPITSVKGAQVPHHKAKTSADIQVHQDDEGAPLGSFHQEEMLDNSIEEEFFTMFADLTPQEQQAVTERLEHTKNCLLARKNHE
ncbi:UNVERIFIED_CONTAM: hypothetical protein K2H54_042107 [Gekko kuhli]